MVLGKYVGYMVAGLALSACVTSQSVVEPVPEKTASTPQWHYQFRPIEPSHMNSDGEIVIYHARYGVQMYPSEAACEAGLKARLETRPLSYNQAADCYIFKQTPVNVSLDPKDLKALAR